jgi:hypothetical protein
MVIKMVVQDDLDLLLSLDVDLQVMLRTSLGVLAQQILAHHDERHQQNVNEV